MNTTTHGLLWLIAFYWLSLLLQKAVDYFDPHGQLAPRLIKWSAIAITAIGMASV